MESNYFNIKVHFSSLVIGFLLATCLMLAAGAAGDNDEVGQYQCSAASDDSLAVFVVETSTGQTWRLSRTDSYDLGTPYSRKSLRKSITPMLD